MGHIAAHLTTMGKASFDQCIFIKYDTKIFGQFSRGYLNIEPHLLSLVLFQQLRIKTISSCFNTQ